ncbi:hypothetical protein GCM10009555_018750 [Acrocarpospora macrocephala]|uniref:Uncharacterized protein n=3 Tax=Acrocarpospora macrocephala TaxID=150177 RepID=A0A5M3WEK6_9ACTN|nr:hypothetical protein Amac_011300 [Acrocarpospora macrocephala]
MELPAAVPRILGTQMSSAATEQGSTLEMAQQQYVHLVRLAWDLHTLGVSPAVELGPERVPAVRISRARGPIRVMAWLTDGAWVFTWGRSRDQRIEVFDTRAAARIARVAEE